MRHEPGVKEDAKNLSVIAGSAAVAALATLALLAANSTAAPEPLVVKEIQPVVVEVAVEPAPVAEPVEVSAPLSGIDRLYGTVTTVHGATATGYLRWDKNEGSWSDLLDATKPRARGGSTISGIRFGHIDRLEVLGGDAALLTLRSGEEVELRGNATDLGSGLRALVIETPDRGTAQLGWHDLASVDFKPAPDTPPAQSRMHGTVTTRSGQQFTGYVTWDVDEIYSTDVLDGDTDGTRMEIPFGQIASIERYASWGARVSLVDGASYVLEGTQDVDASIGGIEVSDPTLGSVKLEWEGFDNVRFHEPESDVAIANFDGGDRIRGTVLTENGASYTGEIIWDADEEFTWEMIQGDFEDVEFFVEFSQVDRIQKYDDGALLTLRDGRALELYDSNDVDHGNRGIIIRTDGREYEVHWRDFAEASFTR